MNVAYQGIAGAYSEEAALRYFGHCAPAGYALSEEVMEAVERGRSDFGILPVENSIAGAVGVNMDLLLARKVNVIGEAYLRIEHCLLGSPQTSLKHTVTVYSHPIALAQCSAFLRRHNLKSIPEYDTAGSAQLVARRRIVGETAIASERCAQIYGLKVLARNIQTLRKNFTRFLIFTKANKKIHRGKPNKTSLAFTAKHKPGALINCLQAFADQKINLTRLESRPVPADPFTYVFFVDINGGSQEPRVQKSLQNLKAHAGRIKILGSYVTGSCP